MFHEQCRCLRSNIAPQRSGRACAIGYVVCRFDAVVHFAGRKAVGESVEFPMLYYTHNIVGAVNLIEAMRNHGVKNVSLDSPGISAIKPEVDALRCLPCEPRSISRRQDRCGPKQAKQATLQPCWMRCLSTVDTSCQFLDESPRRGVHASQMVFSSSCTVYGNPQYVPLDEDHPLKAVSPYGRTKLVIEDMFRDLHVAEPEWRIILLRYFNPVGAHPSGSDGLRPEQSTTRGLAGDGGGCRPVHSYRTKGS